MPEEPSPVRHAELPATDVDFEALARDLAPLGNEKRLALLHFLTLPHYLEEIATHLGMARQAAQKHVDQLLEVGVIRKQQGRRESGPVVEYVVVPQRLFSMSEDFSRLGVLRPRGAEPLLMRTEVGPSDAGASPAEGPALVLVHGMRAGAVFPLAGSPGPWSIGRDAARDVPLDYDPYASSRHAEVHLENGRHVLVDAFSTNGTLLNWERMPRGGRSPLRPGDVVGVGRSLLVFRA